MIVMMPWVLRTWRGLRGRPRIETRGLRMLDRLHEHERAAREETTRLRRVSVIESDLFPRRPKGDTGR